MTKWDKLAAKFPWPAKRPAERDLTGWHTLSKKRSLTKFIPAETEGVLVELGSWKGQSTDWFLKTFPKLKVIAIDHWRGSEEHQKMSVKKDLPRLYETFLGNMWPHQSRLIPVKRDSLAGLLQVRVVGIKPAVIYVDASHKYQDVKADIKMALRLFPKAILVGDDWPFPDVNKAVREAADEFKKKVRAGRHTWQLR